MFTVSDWITVEETAFSDYGEKMYNLLNQGIASASNGLDFEGMEQSESDPFPESTAQVIEEMNTPLDVVEEHEDGTYSLTLEDGTVLRSRRSYLGDALYIDISGQTGMMQNTIILLSRLFSCESSLLRKQPLGYGPVFSEISKPFFDKLQPVKR